YLDAHPECVAIGAWIEVVNETGRHVGLKTFVTTHDEISAVLLRGVSPMAHPTVVARRDALRAVGGYDARCYPSEDPDLWVRCGHDRRRAEPAVRVRDPVGLRRTEAAAALSVRAAGAFPMSEPSSIRRAIEKGVAFLESAQLPSGEIPIETSPTPEMSGDCV